MQFIVKINYSELLKQIHSEIFKYVQYRRKLSKLKFENNVTYIHYTV
jgi:hypothetical protein